ncbi:MAG: ABC transporter permease [Phycisphaeraceae bacterium]|nr:ABC transporter permease [Phycisphaeraceae bacterium]
MDQTLTVHSAVGARLVEHLSPLRLISLLARHHNLIAQFARREVLERHHGAALGVAWNIINPLLSLAVFTFVFGVVLGVSWSEDVNTTGVPFAIILFTGQTIYHIFAECTNRAPVLITSRRNFVRKVVFPLEVLSVAQVASTVVHLGVGIGLIVVATLALAGTVSTTLWAFPLLLVPLYALCLGVSWFLSALGVFLHDVRQITGVATMLLMFCSGVFYPIDRVPEHLRFLIELNPLYILIHAARQTLLWSQHPDWSSLGILTLGSLVLAQLGYAFFAKSKRGMADVI